MQKGKLSRLLYVARATNRIFSFVLHYCSERVFVKMEEKIKHSNNAQRAPVSVIGDNGGNHAMISNLWRMLVQFRRTDLEGFISEHERLFAIAQKTGNYFDVTEHYYSVMASVIEQYYGGFFHFVPPDFKGQSRCDAARSLHKRIAKLLQLKVEDTCLDIGCGIGDAMANIARESGAKVTGVTVTNAEVERGNSLFLAKSLDFHCRIIKGDAHHIPTGENHFNAAYAIYALKYFPNLGPIFTEIHRVLRPGGLFLIYDLVKSRNFDHTNATHRFVVGGFEFSCGMPPLHSNQEMIHRAEESNLKLVCNVDIQVNPQLPWYSTFVENPWFIWLLESPIVAFLIMILECFGVLPKGFKKFNEMFLGGCVCKMVRGGQMGVLCGSSVLVFKKEK